MRLPLIALVFAFSVVVAACDETDGSGVMDTNLSTTELMTEITTAATEKTTEISSTTTAAATKSTTAETTASTTAEQTTSATAALDEKSSSTTEMSSTTTEMATSTRDPLRKWDHTDIEKPFETKEKPCPEKEVIQRDEPVTPCPEGWFHYKESCYLIKKRLATMEMADKLCKTFNTPLFTADTQEELDVISHAAVPGRTWLAFKEDEVKNFWQTGCGMDIENLPWLIKDREYHGWNELSRCAFMYTEPDRVFYTHFSPCRKHMNFICERNATLYVDN